MCLIIGVLVFFFRCSHSVSKLYTLLDNLDLHYVKQVADGVLHNPYYSSYMLMWLFSWIDLYQGKTGIIKWLIRTCLRQQHENNRVKTNVMCILCMSNGYLVSQPNLRCTEQWPFRIPIPAVSDSWLPWHYMCPVYLRLKTNKPTNKQHFRHTLWSWPKKLCLDWAGSLGNKELFKVKFSNQNTNYKCLEGILWLKTVPCCLTCPSPSRVMPDGHLMSNFVGWLNGCSL